MEHHRSVLQVLLKERLLLSLHSSLIFVVSSLLELSPLSVYANANGCDAAGQQHIVCQQRRKCNDDEPHLVDKDRYAALFLQESAYKKRRAQQEKRRNKNDTHFHINFFFAHGLTSSPDTPRSRISGEEGDVTVPFLKNAGKELEKVNQTIEVKSSPNAT